MKMWFFFPAIQVQVVPEFTSDLDLTHLNAFYPNHIKISESETKLGIP